MKKIFTILFLSLYVLSVIGVNVMTHSCGGESTSTLVAVEAKDPCNCGDEIPPADMCCTTIMTTVKIDDIQIAAVQELFHSLVVVDILPIDLFSTNIVENSSFFIQNCIDTSPPPGKDFQTSNSVFLI